MKRIRLSCLLVVLVALCAGGPGTAAAAGEYAGSGKCAGCHADKFAEWSDSGHHLQLRKAEIARHARLPLPPGYTWEDISYVIGGVSKKARFVDRNGYLVTSAKDGSRAKTQYNMENDAWSDYLPGEKKPYDCAYCHTTNYRPKGNQGGLPGIVGTWSEDGVGCEYCHGPSGAHVSDPAKKVPQGEPPADICESCHQRGGITQMPFAEFGLARHHEQLNELKLGAHKGLSCLNCHDPHRRASRARDNCAICHSRLNSLFATSTHGKAGIKCFECHMPRVSKSAISRVSYMGEVRTHLFKINTSTTADMFLEIEENGQKSIFTKGFVTVDFVCLACHGSRDKAWAAKNAKDFHR